jgi:hypothetical protein
VPDPGPAPAVRRVGRRRLAAGGAVAAVLLAGCGHGDDAVFDRHVARPGCLTAVLRVLDPDGGGAVRMTAAPASTGVRGCRYVVAGGPIVVVSVDSNPQAQTRFSRAVVERDQVALWSHHRDDAPRLLGDIGVGADWFPGERELLSTDGRRLVSVRVPRGSRPQGIARAVSVAVLRARVGSG